MIQLIILVVSFFFFKEMERHIKDASASSHLHLLCGSFLPSSTAINNEPRILVTVDGH